ncbi:MAG: thiosulfate dehydrogenase (quinone) large subunit [Solirubrobacteraceae bacterium]|nr:thiosulfate dehydrogenase (quinone) large subunit [Solirubrobacteraceae bacterium]
MPAPSQSALLPLRIFLGATFVYAGIQKLSDPGFLTAGAPTYIGTQLRGFADGTPGGWLLRTFALPHPLLAGAGVAVTEIAVGALVLVGLATRAAALVGLLLNLVLFLTASWKTSPYFPGSDIVFVFAWLPFVLAGAAGQPSLDRAITAARRRGPVQGQPGAVSRRELLGYGWAGVAAFSAVAAGLSVLLKGPAPGRSSQASLAPNGAATPAPTATPRAGRGRRSAVPKGAVELGASSRLGRNQGALYRDPADGQPDIVVRHGDGTLTACSAVCTHAGCSVEYTRGELYCPCHGSAFDARTGAVKVGPAVQPLARKRVEERNGAIYALPS